jgi:methionyl-tRNA formyltransferase
MIAQAHVPIESKDTTGTLTTKLAELGAQLLAKTLPRWIAGEITPQPQDNSLATFAPKLNKEDGHLDWSRSAVELDRRVRAFSPWPGTFTTWHGKLLRVRSVQATDRKAQGAPGLVVKDERNISVVTGDAVLHLATIQLEGKRAMSAADFARGHPSFIGSVLGA